MDDNSVQLEELECPICEEGVHNNQVCFLCLGHGVIFRIINFEYIAGSSIYLQQYSKPS